MPFEWFVALRHLREGRMQTALILGGTTVGVAVLVFLTALISGLQRSLVEQTLSSQAHVIVEAPERRPRVLPPPPGFQLAASVDKAPQRFRSIEQWPQVLALVERLPGVVAATATLAGPAFAARGEASRSVALRGVVDASFDRVLPLAGRMRSGRLRLRGGEAVIGTELASDLGLAVGDKLRVVTAEGRSGLFTVSGIFDIGNKEVNQRWVLVPLHAAQSLLDLVGGVTTIEVRVRETFGADAVAREIQRRTGLAADSWMTINAQLLAALRSQSASSYLIQALVVLAVALGIASVLGVSVIQKSREIGIMKAVGTSTRTVIKVFLVEGALVGLVGSIAGCALGSAMALFFSRLAQAPDGSPIFPVDLGPGLFAMATAVSLLTGLAAAALPARHAARLDPAVVIRYG